MQGSVLLLLLTSLRFAHGRMAEAEKPDQTVAFHAGGSFFIAEKTGNAMIEINDQANKKVDFLVRFFHENRLHVIPVLSVPCSYVINK